MPTRFLAVLLSGCLLVGVAAAPLVTVGGWVQHKGGGYWHIRGLAIEPARAAP